MEDIIAVDIRDGVQFEITKVTDIMEEHDYPGIRFMLNATLDRMRQALKIDISTGDVITPKAVEFSYSLMFEDRVISIWTYNLETLLAEKLETIMARGTANTRMRDFYDIHVISQQEIIDRQILKSAFLATSEKRNTIKQLPDFRDILRSVEHSSEMMKMWDGFQKESFFVSSLLWKDVVESVRKLVEYVL